MGTTISTIKPSCNTNNLIKTKSLLSLSRYSTAAQSKPTNSSRLFQRINPLRDPKVSILPVLDQWITEGNKFKEPDFQRFVRELRASKRYSHALQVPFLDFISLYFVICASTRG